MNSSATDGVLSANSLNGRLIAIGDVHGCFHALETVLAEIAPTLSDHLVFLGDLVDQGKDSKDVLDCIRKLHNATQVTLIQGNHEEMMFAAREDEQSLRYWERCGGVATLNSYRFGGTLDEVPQVHWDLLESAQPFLETEEFVFTHANYLPDVPFADQPGYQLRWGLFDAAKQQPHCSGKTVVVGHTEQKNAEILDRGFAMCIDTACYTYGWLTAIDMTTRQVWQASRWGMLREGDETSHRSQLKELLRPAVIASH